MNRNGTALQLYTRKIVPPWCGGEVYDNEAVTLAMMRCWIFAVVKLSHGGTVMQFRGRKIVRQ